MCEKSFVLRITVLAELLSPLLYFHVEPLSSLLEHWIWANVRDLSARVLHLAICELSHFCETPRYPRPVASAGRTDLFSKAWPALSRFQQTRLRFHRVDGAGVRPESYAAVRIKNSRIEAFDGAEHYCCAKPSKLLSGMFLLERVCPVLFLWTQLFPRETSGRQRRCYLSSPRANK